MRFGILTPFCSIKHFLGFLLFFDYMLLVCSLDDPCYYENGPQTLVQAIQSCGTIPQIRISQPATSDPLANVYQQLKEIPIQQLWVVVIINQQWTYNIMNLTTTFEVDRQNVIAASQTSGLRLDNIEAIASQTLPAICYSCANYTQCPNPQIMHQNKCYWITTVDGDFDTIDATCSASYGILTTIESQATHRLLSIFQESGENDPTWIGLQASNAGNNAWRWSDMSVASFPRDYNGFAQTSSRKKRDSENLFYLLAGYTGTFPQGFTWPALTTTQTSQDTTTPTTQTISSTTERTTSTTQTSKSTTETTTSTTQTSKSTTDSTTTQKTTKTTKTTPHTPDLTTELTTNSSTSFSPTATNSPATTLVIPTSGSNFTAVSSTTGITSTSALTTFSVPLTSVSNGTLGTSNFTLTSSAINPSTAKPVAGLFAITPSGCVTNEDTSSTFAWSSRNCSSRFKGICVAYQSSCDQTSRYYRGKCYSCPTNGLTCTALQCSTGSPVLVNSSTDPITVLINEMQCYAALGLVNCANVFPVTVCEFERILL